MTTEILSSLTNTLETLKSERTNLINQYNTLKGMVELLEKRETLMIKEAAKFDSEEFKNIWNQADEYSSKANDVLRAINAIGNAISQLNGDAMIDTFWG